MDAGSALHGPPLVRPGPGHWAGCITGAGHGVALVAVHWSVSRSHATIATSPLANHVNLPHRHHRHLLQDTLSYHTGHTIQCQSTVCEPGNTMTALCNAARNTRIHSNAWTYYLTTTKINSMMPWNMCPIPDSNAAFRWKWEVLDKPRQGKYSVE